MENTTSTELLKVIGYTTCPACHGCDQYGEWVDDAAVWLGSDGSKSVDCPVCGYAAVLSGEANR